MQWTVRDVPPELDQRVREMAKEYGLSLNKAVIKVLDEALKESRGEPTNFVPGKKRDLSKFVDELSRINSDEDIRRMEEAMKDFEKIDPEMWK